MAKDTLTEEFYQVTPEILDNFPKFRPPLNIYFFNEKVNDVQLYVKKGERLDQNRQEELHRLCENGNIFFARSDYPIYSDFISKQLDLILQTSSLSEGEIADILWKGVPYNLEKIYTQPVKLVFENILPNLYVVCQYLLNDPYRIVGLIRRINPSNDLWGQATNVLFLGLGVYLRAYPDQITEKFLKPLTVGLTLVYLGKTKLPAHIFTKNNLTLDEQKQLKSYPILGTQIVSKFGYREKYALQCILEHQERLDGSGYPQKLSGNQISVPGKIGAVATAFNEMLCSLGDDSIETVKKIAQHLSKQPNKFDSNLVNGLLTIIIRL